MPYFTIITATYNAASTLPRLLESLAAQTCWDFELIIQDGTSTDDTVAVAESYRDRLPSLSLASEPDTGIYDAWNKALPRVRGEWVLFLGADDKLADEFVLEKVGNKIKNIDANIDFISCDLRKVSTNSERDYHFVLLDSPVKALRLGMPCGHPALFHRSRIFSTNKFSTQYKISGDYDFLIRMLKRDDQIVRHEVCAVHMAFGGISSSPKTRHLMLQENEKIWKTYFPVFFYYYKIFSTIKKNAKALSDKTRFTRAVWTIAKKVKFLWRE